MEGEAIYLPGFFNENPRDFSLLQGMMADLEQAGREVFLSLRSVSAHSQTGQAGVGWHKAYSTRCALSLYVCAQQAAPNHQSP